VENSNYSAVDEWDSSSYHTALIVAAKRYNACDPLASGRPYCGLALVVSLILNNDIDIVALTGMIDYPIVIAVI
jgi:hypothetical protein